MDQVEPRDVGMADARLDGPCTQRLSQFQLDALVAELSKLKVSNLVWYLTDKICKGDDAQVRDHSRALKYAYLFARKGAAVTFLRETQEPTPDLEVVRGGETFYVEVKKFRVAAIAPQVKPQSKIVGAVEGKLRQLREGEINLVAIDNFDVNLEHKPGGGFSHGPIRSGFAALSAACTAEPGHYGRLSGVVFRAHTSVGAVAVSFPDFPHYVWLKPAASHPLPEQLARWVVEALPDGMLIRPGEDGP